VGVSEEPARTVTRVRARAVNHVAHRCPPHNTTGLDDFHPVPRVAGRYISDRILRALHMTTISFLLPLSVAGRLSPPRPDSHGLYLAGRRSRLCGGGCFPARSPAGCR